MSFVSNNSEFSIMSDSEISSVIGMFSEDMIYDIVDANYQTRFKPYQLYVGNIIYAIEQQYRQQMINMPSYELELMQSRENTYKTILEKLCDLNGLSISTDNLENTDLYSLVYFLYDFLVSRYTINLINFFSNYILQERDAIYETISALESKKNKDVSSNYSKKIFKGNNKLAAIHANLEVVIDNICRADIDLKELIRLSTLDPNITQVISSNIDEVINTFSTQFVPCVKDPIARPVIITAIRLRLQELAADTQVALMQ